MGKSSGAERSEQSCEEWICIEREQGGYFCGGNGVSPGSRSDMKGVCHDIGKKKRSWVEWVQIAEVSRSQAGRQKKHSSVGGQSKLQQVLN